MGENIEAKNEKLNSVMLQAETEEREEKAETKEEENGEEEGSHAIMRKGEEGTHCDVSSTSAQTRKVSVGSVDSKTEVIDSDLEEDDEDDIILDDDVIEEEIKEDSLGGSPVAPEKIDKGEEADAESDDTGSKKKNKKSKVKTEKKKKRKKKMDGRDVFINGESKKRSRPQPNKRKKIRKLLTEDKLNEETLQALKEEEDRQKRLGLFSKTTQNENEAGAFFDLLKNDNSTEFPELSYNLDFVDDISLEYDSIPSTSLEMLTATPVNEEEKVVLSEATPNANKSSTSEIAVTVSEASYEPVSMVTTPTLQQSESTDSLSNDVARFEQLLRQKSEIGAPPSGQTSQSEELQMLYETSTLRRKPSTEQTDSFMPPSGLVSSSPNTVHSANSSQFLRNRPMFSNINSFGAQSNALGHSAFSVSNSSIITPMQGAVAPPAGQFPFPPYMWNTFKPPAPPASKPPVNQSSEVICISSESSDDERVKQQEKSATSAPIETINISSGSESSDEVICTGTDDHEIVEEDPDVNNSGMHVNDAMNQPDPDGRVLVNKNRPPDEPEIYLSPRLAGAVKPHQIGGIRFMFDNIVESLEHYSKSSGFGCILAHSMGLGKTLQVIAFIDVFLRYTGARTALCVVPVNTLLNWIAEFETWLPGSKEGVEQLNNGKIGEKCFKVRLLSDAHKTTEARAQVISEWKSEGGVLLMGYEMFRLLTNQNVRRRRKKKQKTLPPGGIIETIDLDEEDRIAEMTAEIYKHLVKPGPDLIVCDEGHRIKNSHASISQALKQIATRRRIVLTGYPLQNNLLEYWCMVDFVRPSFLGTKQEFSNMFERPICNGQCADSNESDIRLMRFRSHVLHSLLKGFVQRRSHLVLKNSLPPKEEYVLLVRFSPWQKKLYNTFIKLQKDQGSGSWCSALNPIKAFSICCKIWNHPDVLYRAVIRKTLEEQQSNDLIDMDLDLPDAVLEGVLKKVRKKKDARNEKPVDGSNGKLVQAVGFSPFGDVKDKGVNYDWAKELLKDYTPKKVEFSGKMLILMKIIEHSVSLGDKILVFSQSLTTLTLIEEFLSWVDVPNPPGVPQLQRKWCRNESYFRLDGNTNTTEREKMIQIFNHKDNNTIHLFLLSTRAGCLGINLVGANRVVVFDISWNPCHDAQAVCRVYRYGQTKKCVIYRLICDQSMEKKIYDRQISKQGMSDRVVDELNPIQSLERQDITKLLIYDDDELPSPDLSEYERDCNDETLRDTCKFFGDWLTRKPFYHESLLMDCKGTRLTKAEKRAAQKGYEHEKRAASSCNYSRHSYVSFYAAAGYPQKTTAGSKTSVFSKSSTTDRPVANVKPVQSTPYPMQIGGNTPLGDGAGESQIIAYLRRAGINIRKTIATSDIPLPQSTAGPNSKPLVTAGEPYYMIQGAMGLYIGTLTGRIFALKSQKPDEGKATSPLVQGVGGQMMTTRERESQIIKSAFNAMVRRNLNVHQPIRYPYSNQQPIGAGYSQMTNYGQYQAMDPTQNFGTSQQLPPEKRQNFSMGQHKGMMTPPVGFAGQNFPSTLENSTTTQQTPGLRHMDNPMTRHKNNLNSEVSQATMDTTPSLVSVLMNRQNSLNGERSVPHGAPNLQSFSSAPELTSLLGYDMMSQQNFSTLPSYNAPSYHLNQHNWSSQDQGLTQQTGSAVHTNLTLDPIVTESQSLSMETDKMIAQHSDEMTQQKYALTQQNGFMTQQLAMPDQTSLLSALNSLLPEQEDFTFTQPLTTESSYSLIQGSAPPTEQQAPPTSPTSH